MRWGWAGLLALMSCGRDFANDATPAPTSDDAGTDVDSPPLPPPTCSLPGPIVVARGVENAKNATLTRRFVYWEHGSGMIDTKGHFARAPIEGGGLPEEFRQGVLKLRGADTHVVYARVFAIDAVAPSPTS